MEFPFVQTIRLCLEMRKDVFGPRLQANISFRLSPPTLMAPLESPIRSRLRSSDLKAVSEVLNNLPSRAPNFSCFSPFFSILPPTYPFFSCFKASYNQIWRKPNMKDITRSILLVLGTVFLITTCVHFSWAQTSRGTVAGTVTDQNGAVISGADVELRKLATNETRVSKSNDSG